MSCRFDRGRSISCVVIGKVRVTIDGAEEGGVLGITS